MEAYGKKMALKHLADLSANPDGSFTVSPWDGSTADAICEQLPSRPELGTSSSSRIASPPETPVSSRGGESRHLLGHFPTRAAHRELCKKM
jgi:hypothetical protein